MAAGSPEIKAIGFDWGGVIAGASSVEFDSHIADILAVSVDSYVEAYHRHNDLVSRGEIWRAVIHDLGRDSSLIDDILEYCDNKNDLPDPAMVNILKRLNGNGYKLGLLTNALANTTVPRRLQLQQHDLESLFSVIDISYETGLRKPTQAAYEHFYNQFSGVLPEEMVFIDDVERNLVIPKQLGWQTIFFESPTQLKAELTRLGVV